MNQGKQQVIDDNDYLQAYGTYFTVFHAVVLVSFIHDGYIQGLVNYLFQNLEFLAVHDHFAIFYLFIFFF